MDGCLGNYNESESGGRLRLNSLARTEKGQEERNISGSFCKYLTLDFRGTTGERETLS